MNPLRLCLVIHNHQPIGNFDGVIEQAFLDSYSPFLDVFEQFDENLRLSLHTSGSLMQWLDQRQPEYLDRIAALVGQGRLEIIGGPFYEPILTMIPSRDRIGQIQLYSRWLENRLGGSVRGMWMPERVWEQSLTSDLADAGMQYTVLDDFHFLNAGLNQNQLHGYYTTEDNGRTIRAFPGSERLRYLIPFGQPHETIDHLRGIAERNPNAVAVFGDDGEKFGTWPETKKHVYQDGWLHRFFEALLENRDWLATTTLADAADETDSTGKIYLPDASYREMTEWVLPVARQLEYESVRHELQSAESWPRVQPFVRGGFWRNFKTRYAEADEMYSRMMAVSDRLARLEQSAAPAAELEQARDALYQGQCNCGYWHGAFGGIYLPHLRNAVYKCLIDADNALDRAEGRTQWVEDRTQDWNLDGKPEIRLENDQLVCLLEPSQGGRMYELDVRSISHNLLATLMRRPEAYHRRVLAGPNADQTDVASIHDRVVFKQEGLDQRLHYDQHMRKNLIDHFWDEDATLGAVAQGDALERGDFVSGEYDATVRRNPNRIQVMMTRNGNAWGIPIRITKGVTLNAGSSVLEIAYRLEGLPQDRPLHFGVELNFAGLPAGADDRYFYDKQRSRLGQLGSQLDLQNVDSLGMVDEWLGIDIRWQTNRPTSLWTFPIETVSQSEGGFELVHQSLVLQPHWFLQGDAEGKWTTTMELQIQTTKSATPFFSAAHAAST